MDDLITELGVGFGDDSPPMRRAPPNAGAGGGGAGGGRVGGGGAPPPPHIELHAPRTGAPDVDSRMTASDIDLEIEALEL